MATSPNFLRGNTPRAGMPITSTDFARLSDASTAARQVPQPNVSSVFTAGGIVVFPQAQNRTPVSNVTPLALQPGSDVSTHSAPKYTITYGTYGGAVPTIGGTALLPSTASNIITLGSSDVAVYMQCDFTFDESGNITITDAEIQSTASTIPANTITSTTGAGGSGTLYQLLFGVTITAPVGLGPYTVVAAPAVGGSQNFGICYASTSYAGIAGPWGV